MSQALIAQLERIRRELSKKPSPEQSRTLMRDFQRAVEQWRDSGNPKSEEILRTLREITSALETLYVADRTVETGAFTKDLFTVSGQLVQGVADLVRKGMTAQGVQTNEQLAKQIEKLHLPRIRQWAYTWARTARGAEAQARAMGVRADVAPEQQFFRYDGPVTNMRPFCAARIGQVFSLKEIRAMKSPNGLPVEQYCGGYNCRHRWVRVAGNDGRREFSKRLQAEDAGLEWSKKDKEDDAKKHKVKFRPNIESDEEYLQEAKDVVRNSKEVYVQDYKGQEQFVYIGSRGYAVVDLQKQIRGYYFHEPSGLNKMISSRLEKKHWRTIQ